MNSFIQDSAIDLSLDLQQHYAHLLVFPQCYDSFIPAPHLPISALLDFTNLPPFDHSLTVADLHCFFTSEHCVTNDVPADFLDRSLPPLSLSTQLLNTFSQAYHDGVKSVKDPRFLGNLPFWVVQYWHDLGCTIAAKERWSLARDWLSGQRENADTDLAAAIDEVFSSLRRPIKLAIKEFQHADIVNETLTQLSSGTVASDIRLDTTKGTLRDRSVRWFVEAYKAVNKTDLIKKAFALCKAGEDDKSNLSFESLTNIDTLRDLRDLPRTDPDMWQRIQLRSTTTRINDDSVDAEVSLPEDDVVESDGVNDEAPLEVVLEHIMSDKTYVPEGYIMGTDGSLIVDGAADKHCDMISPSDSEGIEEAGRGKRWRIANTQYGEYDAH
ncbi:hypothetical protein F4604DRAFT_1938376 [Suillus subluteus]|nr:hypothetical protein F4604DRAFT_1938376 [Suillus subluteus]